MKFQILHSKEMTITLNDMTKTIMVRPESSFL